MTSLETQIQDILATLLSINYILLLLDSRLFGLRNAAGPFFSAPTPRSTVTVNERKGQSNKLAIKSNKTSDDGGKKPLKLQFDL